MKRKNVQHIILLLVCFFLYSCVENKQNKINELAKFEAEVNQIDNIINYDDLILECKLVQLETSSQCLLGDIKKLLVSDEKIIVLSNDVYCFDNKGNFLFALDKRGKGPDEFIRIDDISISNNQIYLYDNSQWKILSFDINSGDYLTSYRLPYSVPRIEIVGDKMIVDRLNFPNKLMKGKERIFISALNTPQHVISSYFSEQEYEIETEFQFTGYNGAAYLSNPFRGRVYKLQADSVENYFQIKSNKMLTDNDIGVLLKQNIYSTDAISASGKAYGFERFFESNNFITYDFFIGNKKAYLVYDKNTRKNRVFCDVKREYYQYPPIEFIGVYDDYFCKIINSETIVLNNRVYLSDHKIDDLKLKTDSTYRIINTVSSEDNPIIALYKFKNIN